MNPCWARCLFITLVATLGVGQMLAACGQKGDLYLPEKEAAAGADVPATSVPEIDADAAPELGSDVQPPVEARTRGRD